MAGIDLVIEPNTRIAFVGASGSGKSTLFKVLLRLVEETTGRISANGVEAHRYAVAAWREQFGFVPQAEYLVSGTVADNIAYGVRDASKAAIEEAAREAHAHDLSPRSRRVTTRVWARWAIGSRAGRSSASASRAPS
ncbi:MAG: ATP-binding cassette domain-containing protein [Gammaproteobacteria bacterium]|nr:ATP-binding cassette domain-containing protein [Gammaproteobacteria bacterium]